MGYKLTLLGLAVFGISAGALASAGVFTVLIAAALVPRFVGKSETGRKIILYENMVVIGTILGAVISIFEPFCLRGYWAYEWISWLILILTGFFTGIFVGCLAISIAEMIESMPIFFRRIRLKNTVSIVIWMIALGKIAGSLIYFWKGMKEP